MSQTQVAENQQPRKDEENQEATQISYTNSSTSSSISLVKLDELSSFGATKQSRLPALIKLNSLENQQTANKQANSMPAFSVDDLEQSQVMDKQQASLPAQVKIATETSGAQGKENLNADEAMSAVEDGAEISEDFQVVDMISADMLGPSLPPKSTDKQHEASEGPMSKSVDMQRQVFGSNNQQYPSHLGDSLIEMVINLRNENQNLVRALETNNEYVKERLNEFKRAQEEAKKREAKFAVEKADHEHQARKLQRQNKVLSDRLKSMEAKLKDMKLEVCESLDAAHSSKASSVRDEQALAAALYPNLDDSDSFNNSALNNAVTMQLDATSGELYNNNDNPSSSSHQEQQSRREEPKSSSAPEMDTETLSEGQRVAGLTKEELSKRFDADKAQFYSTDDPMKQCDQLEKQLNDIGKRDYEICLLQQQLNIYRQDFRLERMEKLEAKIQIEKLKNDIDRLCLERIHSDTNPKGLSSGDEMQGEPSSAYMRHSRHRSSGGVRFDPALAAAEAVGKLGHQLSKRAVKSAAKAAKYAAKQAHRDEKAAAYAAAKAAAEAAAMADRANASVNQSNDEYHHRRHSSHHSRPRAPGIRSEVVNDLLSTANKAMLTGYKMVSTHVNLGLDKLSAYEQAQASNLAANKQNAKETPTAPMGPPPSID